MTDSDAPADEERAVRPFAAWLQDHRGGRLHAELTAVLADVTDAVKAHNKAGSVTVKIDLKPQGNMVVVSDRVTAKLPEGDPDIALYFVDDDGNLVRDDPNQPKLPLREVPRTDDQLKEAR